VSLSIRITVSFYKAALWCVEQKKLTLEGFCIKKGGDSEPHLPIT